MRRCWGTTPVFQTEEPTGVERAQWSGGPGRGSRRRQLHSTLTYFACNSPEQQSKRAQKPQNINDPISKLEIWAGELHATLLGNHSGISNGRTHRRGESPMVRRARPRLPQTAATLNPDIFRMQFPRATIKESSKTAEYQRSDFKT